MTNDPLRARSRDEFVAAVVAGAQARYVFFWGHSERDGEPTAACLSQWYPAAFEIDDHHYPTAEHFLMAEKARLFGDANAERAILAAAHPGEAKDAGRRVQGFDEQQWEARRFEIGVEANVAKFGQNPRIGTFLDATRDRVLVEASPLDRIWGIGMAADDPRAGDPAMWQGLNLLGFVLMETRARRLA